MQKHLEKFKSLEKGKKIKLIIVIVVLVIIIYMLTGLFSGGGSNNSTPATTSNTPANSKAPLAQSQQAVTVVQKQTIEKSNTITNNLNEKQRAYLATVNELQMLQLKQQIAQTKQQIAQAELQAAQSKKQLQDLTTPAPPPPSPIFANQPQNPGMQPILTPIQSTPNYQLAYIANEGGKWQVIISNNGGLINATMGSILPDGSVITNISGTSVTLSLNDQTKVLTIEPSF